MFNSNLFGFLLGWFRVDSRLGQWFIAGWLEVGAKICLKSLQDLFRNLWKIHWMSCGIRFGIWVCFELG